MDHRANQKGKEKRKYCTILTQGVILRNDKENTDHGQGVSRQGGGIDQGAIQEDCTSDHLMIDHTIGITAPTEVTINL